jgi:hypothetical protein
MIKEKKMKKNIDERKFELRFKVGVLSILLLAGIFFIGCIAAIPVVVHYYKTNQNYVATAEIRQDADEAWLAVLRLAEKRGSETGGQIKIVKRDDTERLLEVTDEVQTAEIKIIDEGRRKSKIIITADVPDESKETELAKEQEFAMRIMKDLCQEAKAECKFVEE